MRRKRARVSATFVIVSGGKVRGSEAAVEEELRASKREMPARSRYIGRSNRVCGGVRSEMEKRMPLL